MKGKFFNLETCKEKVFVISGFSFHIKFEFELFDGSVNNP